MLPSVQCFLTFSGLSTTVLNPSASANLKPRVAEKRLNMEWIWGQQNRMGCGLACSWHTHAATFFKSFLAGIFGYKICPFVTAGIQPWCSCCQLTQEWPSNCHMSPRPPIYSNIGLCMLDNIGRTYPMTLWGSCLSWQICWKLERQQWKAIMGNSGHCLHNLRTRSICTATCLEINGHPEAHGLSSLPITPKSGLGCKERIHLLQHRKYLSILFIYWI